MWLGFFIAILIALISFSAFLSGSETAFFSLSSLKIHLYKRDLNPKKRLIAELLKTPHQLLVSLLMLNIAVNILIQNVVANVFGDGGSFLLSVGVPLVLVLLFGEMLPKAIAIRYNREIAYRFVRIIHFFKICLSPIRFVLSGTALFISKIIFCFLPKEKEISVKELETAIKSSKELGVISPDEMYLMRGYLDLDDHIVKELMRSRHEIIAYDIQSPIEKLLETMIKKECSKIPVYDGSLEKILGFIFSRDLFLHNRGFRKGFDVVPLLRKPFYVPESVSARHLMQQFHFRKEEIAIVVDEYGSIAGLITLEDLMEVVVGPIQDKIDPPNRLLESSEDILISNGLLEVVEIENRFDVELKSPSNMVTVGGWLTERLGDIPKVGDRLIVEPLLFHILAADEKTVQKVYIRKLPTKGEGE
ncbi:MAG: HlyC/CorC family transporter [Chlamydiae bacterium]|nr:HlyC/CorC family transporter [Chlamydiota bacterium]